MGQIARLRSIRQQIDLLRQEEWEIIQTFLPSEHETEPQLFFDDPRRRIRWGDGSVVLAPKQYLLLKTVWQGEEHFADIETLESAVWGVKEDEFVKINTISMLADRTRNRVKDTGFPYKLECVKNFSLRSISGFRLVSAAFHKNS